MIGRTQDRRVQRWSVFLVVQSVCASESDTDRAQVGLLRRSASRAPRVLCAESCSARYYDPPGAWRRYIHA